MKRVLVITYYWPPSGGSGVQRWVKFARYLSEYGWAPVIYTPENPELIAVDDTLGAEIPAGVEVLRRPIREPYAVYRRLFGGRREGARGGEVNPIHAGGKSWKQRLALFLRGNLFVPDPRVGWVRPSVRFLRKWLKDHPVDALVSTGPPHSMHLIALRLSRETGIPWVADFRDPWTRMFYFKHLSLTAPALRRHRRLEREVLDGASAVVAVSPLVQEEFRSMTETPVELITNGFDEADFAGPADADDGRFKLVHTGLFASDGIPDALWRALAEKVAEDEDFASKLQIQLVGKTDREVLHSLEAAGLKPFVTDFGYCSHADAVRRQRAASVLLLPLRKEPEYRATLPGKLFEYLAADRPILGIGQTDGAMASVVRASQAGTVCDWEDEQGLRRVIDGWWDRFRSGEPLRGAEDIGRFSRRRLTESFARLLDRLTENGNK